MRHRLYKYIMDVASAVDCRFEHGCTMLSGYSLFGRPSFIPMKAAQWHMRKMANFLGLKIPGSEADLLHHWAHRASTLETLLLWLFAIPVKLLPVLRSVR